MKHHLRGNLWLLCLTLIVCSVVYPLILWGISRMPYFRDTAEGSLIVDREGKVIGARPIAQPFTADEFFQPRPSAASYNGMASSGSNWGANNYLLRDRVARALGPIVRYGKGAEKIDKKPGDGVQADVETWFKRDRYQGKAGIVTQWAELHPGLGEAWLKSTGDALKDQWKADKDTTATEAFVLEWQADLPELYSAWTLSDGYLAWKAQTPAAAAPDAAALVEPFFKSFATKYPGEWPVLEDYETKEKQQRKRLARVSQGSDIQSVFFDMWRQDHPDVPLEPIPADMVMASGSGLDPHITLANALYQLKYRIAAAQATKLVAARAEPTLRSQGPQLTEGERQKVLANIRATIEDKLGGNLEEKVQAAIAKLLEESQEAPLGGLVGVPLVNVLELNVAMQRNMETFGK